MKINLEPEHNLASEIDNLSSTSKAASEEQQVKFEILYTILMLNSQNGFWKSKAI